MAPESGTLAAVVFLRNLVAVVLSDRRDLPMPGEFTGIDLAG